jgi:hypothetical protein
MTSTYVYYQEHWQYVIYHLRHGKVNAGKSYRRGRLPTVDLLVLTSLKHLLFMIKILFRCLTKQATLLRRSTVLSLSPQLVFPCQCFCCSFDRLRLQCYSDSSIFGLFPYSPILCLDYKPFMLGGFTVTLDHKSTCNM